MIRRRRGTEIFCTMALVAGCSGTDAGGTADMTGSATTTIVDADGGVGGGQSDGLAGNDPVTGCPPGVAPLAGDVTLQEIALYQGVKITLEQNGVAIARNAPVIQGRAGLIRVFVVPNAGWRTHPINALLTLDNDGVLTQYAITKTPGDVDEGDLNTTFNFYFNAEDIGPNTGYSIQLLESTCAESAGDTTFSSYPNHDGTEALQALKTGPLRLTLVPVQYNPSGGYTPDAAAMYAGMANTFMRLYPITDIQLEVREPLEWDRTLTGSGQGWERLLMAVLNLQAAEADPGEYYYGLIATTTSFAAFCRRGCVAGIAPVPPTGGFYGGPRASGGIGIGYNTEYARETAAHEIGHAHGRPHAPCAPYGNPQGVDPFYPHAGADIGVWGYDILSGTLKAPSGYGGYKDVMSYCEPTWISDYTYKQLAYWASEVNASIESGEAAARVSGPRWHSLILYPDGTSEWGAWQPAFPPAGSPERVQVRGPNGRPLADVDAVRMELADTGSQVLLIPEPQITWQTLVLPDRVLDLDRVIPAVKLPGATL